MKSIREQIEFITILPIVAVCEKCNIGCTYSSNIIKCWRADVTGCYVLFYREYDFVLTQEEAKNIAEAMLASHCKKH
jgi:hypothetical protein